MLYLLFFILFLILILCINKTKTPNIQSLIFVLIAYFFAICAQIIYLSKDGNYCYIITEYFYLPNFVWRKLFFLRINRLIVVRFLNLSNLSIIFFMINFALTFCPFRYIKYVKRIRRLILLYVLFCSIIYDPLFNTYCYYSLYPAYMLPMQYRNLEIIVQLITHYINLFLICSSIIIVFLAFLSSPPISMIKQYYFIFLTSYISICGYYIAFLSFAPSFYIKISKLTASYTFRSIKLGSNVKVYQVFPYFLIFALLFIAFSIFRLSYIKRKLSETSLEISTQIDASETTSKVFCHFIKNELVAIQAELEDIPPSEETKVQMAEILQRCENLYTRIDEIHRSTKTSEIHMIEQSLQEIILKTTDTFHSELHTVHIVYDMPSEPVIALLDEVYFGQALHNVIRNSLDAMEGLDLSRRNIEFHINAMERWIVLSINDTGSGILKSNLQRIFTPFFSSYPLSKHWGIGLPLSYKLIKAHNGKIEVESTYDKGTTVKIFLPNVKNIYCQ